MPKKKRQHYVPKFLIRKFGDSNESSCNLFVLNIRKIVRGASIAGQCQESYFYGKDEGLEEMFGGLERDAAAALGRIAATQPLWKSASEAHVATLTFVVSLKGRTRSAVDDLEAIVDGFSEEVIKPHLAALNNVDPKEFDGIKIKLSEPALFSVSVSTPNMLICLDLGLKVLGSADDSYFILSDDPVITINQAYNDRSKLLSTTGFAMNGLQMLVPISSKLCLFYYDKSFYKVGSAKSGEFVQLSAGDTKWINLLSVCNSGEKFFFPAEMQDAEIDQLFTAASKYRVEARAKTITREVLDPTGKTREILHSLEEDLRVPIKWEFCKIRRDRRGKRRPEFGVRDPVYVHAHRAFFSRPADDPRRLADFFIFSFQHFGFNLDP